MKWLLLLSTAAIIMYFTKKSLSRDGVDIIKRFEKFMPNVYLDQADKPTIGYGYLIRPGEDFTNITLSEQEAHNLLISETSGIEDAINSSVMVPLNQNQFNALVSLIYNIGITAFYQSTLLKKLNAYDYQGALFEFSRWNKITKNGEKIVSNGLVKRRAIEQELFIS